MDESDARFIGTVLPLDDVASDDVGLVGRLAELLSRVRGLSDACATPKTLPDWLALCREVVEELTDVRRPTAGSTRTRTASWPGWRSGPGRRPGPARCR